MNADIANEKTEIGSVPVSQPPTRKDGAEEHGIASQATRKEEVDVQGTPLSGLGTFTVQSGTGKRNDMVPKVIGGYEIGATLGVGGMGVVYKAVDLELKRVVALKLIRTGPDASPDEMSRFRGEAEVVAQLQHPNIVQIYDIGMHEGQAFIVFEYVDGGNLADRIQGKPQPPRQAAEMAETLARAMHVAHLQHIIHRDLKPANILLTKSGTLKITDFGLAKQLGNSLGLSHTGDVMGTPSYMAPEQAAGQLENLGPSTDVYALGAILYELLTGRPPFRGVTMFDTLEQVRSAEPAPLSRLVPKLHRDLGTICLKCLQKTPDKRYGNAHDLADDLRRWLDGDPIAARPVSRREKIWRQIRRHPWQTASAVACVLALTLLTLLGLVQREKTYQQEVQEAREKYFAVQDQKGIELKKQQELMQNTMDNILDLVKENGVLSAQKGLDPLYDKLREFYQKLIRQQKENKYADLPNLAKACFNLGDLLNRSGKQQEAVEVLTDARNLYGGLGQNTQYPAEQRREFHFQQAAILVKLGRVLQDMAHKDEAAQVLTQATSELRALLADEPGRWEYKRSLAEAWHLQGELHATFNRDYKTALECYNESLVLRRELCKGLPITHENYPDCLRDLARGYGYMGDVLLDQFHFSEADAAYWASHRIREQLAKSGNHEAQFQLSRSFGNFANYQLRRRSPQTALTFLKQALPIQEKLATEHPGILDYVTAQIGTHNRMLEVELMMLAQADEFQKDSLRQDIRTLTASLCKLIETHGPNEVALLPSKPVTNLPRNLLRSLAEARLLVAMALANEDVDQARRHCFRGKRMLESLRQIQPKAIPGQDFDDPDLLYLNAMMFGMDAELRYNREQIPGQERRTAEDSLGEAERNLRLSLASGYRRKHIHDIRDDRAFQALRLHRKDAFDKLIAEFEKQRPVGDGKAAAAE